MPVFRIYSTIIARLTKVQVRGVEINEIFQIEELIFCWHFEKFFIFLQSQLYGLEQLDS